MTSLADLRRRVEAATGPSREIDADVYEVLGFTVKRRSEEPSSWRHHSSRSWVYLHESRWYAMEPLSRSLDAVVALIERVMAPGEFVVVMTRLADGRFQVGQAWLNALSDDDADIDVVDTRHPNDPNTPPLALLAAFLAALEAKEATDEV